MDTTFPAALAAAEEAADFKLRVCLPISNTSVSDLRSDGVGSSA